MIMCQWLAGGSGCGGGATRISEVGELGICLVRLVLHVCGDRAVGELIIGSFGVAFQGIAAIGGGNSSHDKRGIAGLVSVLSLCVFGVAAAAAAAADKLR